MHVNVVNSKLKSCWQVIYLPSDGASYGVSPCFKHLSQASSSSCIAVCERDMDLFI